MALWVKGRTRGQDTPNPMSIFDQPPRYRSYLLTCWEERSRDPGAPDLWRFSLKDPNTGQRRGFADLEEMLVFLRGELAGGQANQPDG